ncbi:uncharacterized protein LOC135468225 [Liolophura sinensis]|uniref:uncharacterized protein LOC135468225 n=1 Tax=Liolophura sinensis TaxID=3198878 RepID=UPI0031587245
MTRGLKAKRQADIPPLNSLDWEQVSVVKGRLRQAIQEKRAMNGKDALCLDFILDSPVEDKSLAPEELLHIQRRAHVRKERNRLAAQRMRERRKSYCDKLVQELETLEDSNNKLVWEIRSLESEKSELESILKTHLQSCEKVQPKTVPMNSLDCIQPLDLRTRPCKQELEEVEPALPPVQPEVSKVTEQDFPLDLRVMKNQSDYTDCSEVSTSKRLRTSSL